MNVTNKEGGSTRALVHLQMMGWKGPDMPLSPASLVDTALAVLEQKSRATTLVHCLEGSSKSGTFLPLLWLVADMENGQISSQNWPPLVQIMAHVVRQRKGIVRGKQYIGLLYQALLHYCKPKLLGPRSPDKPKFWALLLLESPYMQKELPHKRKQP